MKWLFTIVILGVGFSLSFNTVNGQIPDFLWAQRCGGMDNDDWQWGIATDRSGNIIITGGFEGTASFGNVTLTSAGIQDIFIAKYGGSGDLLWAKRAGGPDRDWGWGAATDGSDNIVVAGFFSGTAAFGDTTIASMGEDDVFIAKYDPDGNLLWLRQAGGPDLDQGTDLAVDGSGNIAVTGYFNATATFSDTTLTSVDAEDIFIAQYDSKGMLLWAQRAGGEDGDGGLGIAAQGSGAIVVTGVFYGAASFGDTMLTDFGSGECGGDVFIAKYDGGGNFHWARQAGGTCVDVAWGIAMDGSGNVVVTGEVESTTTFGDTTLLSFGGGPYVFVAKYDDDGNFIWAQRAGGPNSGAGGTDLAVDGSGDVVVTGGFGSTASFGDTSLTSLDGGWGDIFIVKYDESGNILWAQRAGGSRSDFGMGVATDNFGNIVVTGAFQDTADFGGATLTSTGRQRLDIFIAKIETEAATGIEQKPTFPRSFHLMQNYPNPFNPSTTIEFALVKRSTVKLQVFDITGREVATLVDGALAPGSYKVVFEATGLPSGIYFYRITAGQFEQTRRLLLLK